jgi:hypothetical protein
MDLQQYYLNMIREWEYCYCKSCKRIRSVKELTATNEGIKCSICHGFDLDPPGWVVCPHQKVSAVKCPRSGRGIAKHEHGYECKDRCHFRDIEV